MPSKPASSAARAIATYSAQRTSRSTSGSWIATRRVRPGIRSALAQLQAVSERVVHERALDAGNRVVVPRAGAGRVELRQETHEVVYDKAGMGLARGVEGLLNPDVQLLRPCAKPAAVRIRQRARFRELLQAEQCAVERARLRLGPCGSRDLDVIDAEDPHSRVSTTARAAPTCAARARRSRRCRPTPPGPSAAPAAT